jgi:hypothetical protein
METDAIDMVDALYFFCVDNPSLTWRFVDGESSRNDICNGGEPHLASRRQVEGDACETGSLGPLQESY